TVSSVNDTPINAMPSAQSLDQDSSLTFSSGNGNLISVGDSDSGGGIEQVILTVTNGTLTLSGTTGLSFSSGDGTADATMTFLGTLTDINNALNGMVFNPTAGYNGSASLQITTSDLGLSGSGGAQTDSDAIVITVNSINPVVTSVQATNPDGSYKVGDSIAITITFDQTVTVDTSGGVPTLLLETGTIDHQASYVSGSGSDTLTFSYTVQAGDVSGDLDYQSTGALVLNGATIRNTSSTAAILTLPATGGVDSIAGQHDLVIDGIAPGVSSVEVPANGTYVAGQNLDFTVNYDDAVMVDTSGGTPRLAITLDTGGTVFARYVSGSGGNALVFRLTVASGQLDSDGIRVGGNIDLNGASLHDAVGNAADTTLNSIGNTNSVRIDAVAPVAVSLVRASTSPTAASTVQFTLSFSEAVNGVDIGDFSLLSTGNVVGTLDSVAQLDSHTYQVIVTGVAGSGSLGLALNAPGSGIADAAGNHLSTGLIGESYDTAADSGDPEFRATPAVVNLGTPSTPVQLSMPALPPPPFSSPLLPMPLFEQPTLGSGIPTLGTIFINHGALAPSFIAQVFASSDPSGGDGSSAGFLGFGGGNAGIFGSSTLSNIFGAAAMPEFTPLEVFDGQQWRGAGDANQGLRGVFGTPTLGQQLHDIHEAEQRNIHKLAWALGQFEPTKPQA
ncbi:Ig-like domain-containing protein, partial [Pseudomonas sp. sp1636]|uniref:beta strand repeat-containing protein n=1 Tax=Pseudomonas sp. sp1636 TaxID=3036707 RepID=UPI0025A52E7D